MVTRPLLRQRKTRRLASILLVPFLVCLVADTARAQEYRTVDIEGARWTFLADINDAGAMVGAYTDQEGATHGFVLNDGQPTVLDYPGAIATQPFGINNNGDIVGYATFSDPNGVQQERAFRWNQGVFSSVATPGLRSGAFDINDAGVIVGFYEAGQQFAGFITRPGQPSQGVPFPGLGGYFSSVSNAEVAVGGYTDEAFMPGSVRYANGVMSVIDLTATGISDCAVPSVSAISNTGSYSGLCLNNAPDGSYHAFAVIGGRFERVAYPGAFATGPGGINASGTVVGSYIVYDPLTLELRYHGFVSRRVELLDPLPDLRRENAITQDFELLGTEGRLVQGVAADGVARVVVRIPAASPGLQFTVRLLNDAEPHAPSTSDLEDGEISSILAQASGGNLIVTNAESTAAGDFAFVVYRSPADFPRAGGQDETKAKRQVFLEIQAQGEAPYTQAVEVIRPPVFLVHGLWSDPRSWDTFSPLSTGVDGRFVTGRADYSARVAVTSSVPAFSADKLARVNGNSLGFRYNATTVDEQMKILIDRLRTGDTPTGVSVAAVQADVVGHSMGGAIARTLATLSDYLEPQTFGAGRVHKLVTIDTPHLGSPIATRLLAAENSCLRELLTAQPEVFGINLFTINNFALAQATLAGGAVADGAIGDLADLPLSPALQRLTTHALKPLPTAFIAGRYEQWSSLDSSLPFGRSAQIRRACTSSPLAGALTSTGWPALFGGDPSDGVVGRQSQMNGSDQLGVHEFSNFVHSRGTQDLGFEPPNILFPGPVPVQVIRALNEPYYAATFFRSTP